MNKDTPEGSGMPDVYFSSDAPVDKLTRNADEQQPSSPKDSKPKAKRKRKSPAVPWKKPKDMPKRPLSAYNLFFRDEREKLLNKGKEASSGEGKKKATGIGFANLAKTIAAKWNELAPELRAPYEEIAAKEKAKYDEAVAKWRVEQKEKQAKEKAMKKEAEKQATAQAMEMGIYGLPGVEGYSRDTEGYPSQWFHTGMESADREAGIPPFVDAANDDSARSYSSLSPDSPRRRMRPSPPMHSGGTSHSSSSTSTDLSAYYAQHPYYIQQDPYGRGGRRGGHVGRRFDPYSGPSAAHMSGSSRGRSPSMPQVRGPHLSSEMDRISSEVAELRRSRNTYFQEGEGHFSQAYPAGRYPGRSGPTPPSGVAQMHPRSSSLPASFPGMRAAEHPASAAGPSDADTHDPAYRESKRARRSRGSPTGDEAVFEASLRSLSENLDDDAISFLTNVRFE